jgi:hypothetical protein
MQNYKKLLMSLKGNFVVLFLSISIVCRAEKIDSTANIYHLTAAANVTNNGVSLLPTFTLGKPAAIFDLSVGNEKIAFEPQFRFSLEGKPWSFIFWWRYKISNTPKFKFSMGTHPSVAFKNFTLFDSKGTPTTILGHHQYWATEFSPNWIVAKNVSLGVYYLYSHGLSEGSTNNTNFITINSTISNIPIVRNVFLRVSPQFYFLKMDEKSGFYTTATLTLSHKKSPFFISSVLNKKLSSDIPGDDFIWNISLHYLFSKKLRKF